MLSGNLKQSVMETVTQPQIIKSTVKALGLLAAILTLAFFAIQNNSESTEVADNQTVTIVE